MIMKRQIMFEHRAALDAYEYAKNKHVLCRRKSGCGDVNECVDCPFFQTKRVAEEVFEEKSAVLKEVNEQVVQQNDVLAQRQVIERKQQRLEKRQRKKNVKTTTSSNPKVAWIPKKQRKEVKKEMPVAQDVATNLTRKDLTKERYLQHRDVENITQAQIAKMYNIPYGSITNFIKKLMAPDAENDVVMQEVDNPTELVSLQEKYTNLAAEHGELVKAQHRIQESYNGLHTSYNKLQQELAASQEMNQHRKEAISILESELEAARRELEKQNTSTIEVAEQEPPNEPVDDFKELYVEERMQRMQAENKCNDIERRYNELLQTYNKRTSAFKEYEIQVLGRLLSEIKS